MHCGSESRRQSARAQSTDNQHRRKASSNSLLLNSKTRRSTISVTLALPVETRFRLKRKPSNSFECGGRVGSFCLPIFPPARIPLSARRSLGGFRADGAFSRTRENDESPATLTRLLPRVVLKDTVPFWLSFRKGHSPVLITVVVPVFRLSTRGRRPERCASLSSTAPVRRAQTDSRREAETGTKSGVSSSPRFVYKCLRMRYNRGMAPFPTVGKGVGISAHEAFASKKVCR
jgi:hypothetical protein